MDPRACRVRIAKCLGGMYRDSPIPAGLEAVAAGGTEAVGMGYSIVSAARKQKMAGRGNLIIGLGVGARK